MSDLALDSQISSDKSKPLFDPELSIAPYERELSTAASKSTVENLIPGIELSDETEPKGIDKPGDYKRSLTIDGETRNYYLHVPPGFDPSKPMPLVLVLHGHGDHAASVSRISGMDEKADKEGFIVAYPEATHWLGDRSFAAWDTGNGLVPPGAHADDIGFLRKVIDTSSSEMPIDPNRVYLVGFSNGAMEAYRAGAEISDKLAAVVAVSGAMSGKEGKPEFPISMLSIVGTADSGVPYTGLTREEVAAAAAPDKMRMLSNIFPILKDSPFSPAVSDVLQWLAVETEYAPVFKPVTFATDYWKSVNGINAEGTKTNELGVIKETYTDPSTGVTVQQEIVPGGDHMIQNGYPAGYNLSDDIWNFLRDHPKRTA